MKVISQETFDEVVLEGVKEFDNPLDEAVADAIKEFEAQGVQLANIVTNMRLSDDKERLIHDIVEAIKLIKNYVEDVDTIQETVLKSLDTFTKECRVSLGHRVLANTNDSYSVLIKFITKVQDTSNLLESGLMAITALTITNSDILEAEGATLMIILMENWATKDDGSAVPQRLALWCLESCLKHEMNRQNLVHNKIMSRIINLMKGHSGDMKVVKACAKALRGLMLDDDIRQDFSKSHDHARELVEEHGGIPLCLGIIKEWLNDESASEIVFELLSTLSRQCVRADYCQQAVDCGSLVIINDILVSFPNAADLNKQAINLLKTISGNDQVKQEAMKSGVPYRVIASLNTHQTHPGVCEAGCAAIAMVSLRSPENSKELIKADAGQVVIQAMKIHPQNKQVQKFGCMALRNLSTRVPENKSILLQSGAEDVVQRSLQIHGSVVKDLAVAALRDLGVSVELIEQWRGTGHEIDR